MRYRYRSSEWRLKFWSRNTICRSCWNPDCRTWLTLDRLRADASHGVWWTSRCYLSPMSALHEAPPIVITDSSTTAAPHRSDCCNCPATPNDIICLPTEQKLFYNYGFARKKQCRLNVLRGPPWWHACCFRHYLLYSAMLVHLAVCLFFLSHWRQSYCLVALDLSFSDFVSLGLSLWSAGISLIVLFYHVSARSGWFDLLSWPNITLFMFFYMIILDLCCYPSQNPIGLFPLA